MKVWMYIVGAIVLVLAAGGGGFFAGTVYAQNQAQAANANFARQRAVGQSGQNAQAQGPCGFVGGGFAGGNGGAAGNANTAGNTGGNSQRQNQFAQMGSCVARGQIKSVDPSTGTVVIATAVNDVTVTVDTTTQISKTDLGTIQDLKPGDRVTVFSKDTNANPTATLVQLQNAAGVLGGN